ncbi:transposase, partial [Nostoc sp.]|uniref:transposase n=1 Tax=Nostoc sp. TaxID=1180 RepID=UPI003FA59CAB
ITIKLIYFKHSPKTTIFWVIFIRFFLTFNTSGSGAVVVMDNLSAHKLDSIVPMIEAVGAKVICLSSYSPDFNPIELWWSQLKSFLRSFAPTTTEIVDQLISVALDLINPQHLRNWFASCCYCTS